MKKSFSRRDFIKSISIGAAALSLPRSVFVDNVKQSERPNILFIMSDDHAANAISSYGSKIINTPNIDRIGKEGVRFEKCFCTNSICAPSRASILTGQYSHIHGVTDNKKEFDENTETFPLLLQQSGYETALVGKWHLKSTPKGFDYWNILPGQGHYYNPDFIEMGEQKRYEGYVTDLISEKTINWLKIRNPQKPFCLLCQHKATHSNWMPPIKYLTKFDDVDIPLPSTFFDDYNTRSKAASETTMRIAEDFYYGWHLKLDPELDTNEKIQKLWKDTLDRMNPEQRKAWDEAYGPKNKEFYESDLTGDELAKWKYERYIKDYLRCVLSLDDNIGKVLDYLDSSGLSENTIVVYTSDQGFFLGEHGWWDKRFIYEESLQIPLLIRYPMAIKPGSINDDTVLNIDFAPTFLATAGLNPTREMQGESFMESLKGNTPPDWRTSVYYHYYEFPGRPEVKKHYGIRTKRYKLIHFYDDIDAWELYDLQTDPHELNNLYGDPAYSEVIEKLKIELDRLRRYYKEL